jgi:hypothetical protein
LRGSAGFKHTCRISRFLNYFVVAFICVIFHFSLFHQLKSCGTSNCRCIQQHPKVHHSGLPDVARELARLGSFLSDVRGLGVVVLDCVAFIHVHNAAELQRTCEYRRTYACTILVDGCTGREGLLAVFPICYLIGAEHQILH